MRRAAAREGPGSAFAARDFAPPSGRRQPASAEAARPTLLDTYLAQRRAARRGESAGGFGSRLGASGSQRLTAGRENATGIPEDLKSGVERLSGVSLDDVRVRYNSPQPARVQALAYTQGSQIHIAPGQEKHLPHEAWHAAQQKQGRVRPTGEVAGLALNDDPRLEKEADEMGARASRMGRAPDARQSERDRQD